MKTILHLCSGIGSDSKPYKDNGYNVITVGEKEDVRKFIPPDNVYGIIANPPCTNFSFARTNAKTPRNLKQGIELVEACLKIVWECQFRINKDAQKYSPLKFWMLENPCGMLQWFLGKPVLQYSPDEYGDTYQKKTHIWGYFNVPDKTLNKKKCKKFDSLLSKEIHPKYYGKLSRTDRRSLCSEKFAQAFYEANK